MENQQLSEITNNLDPLNCQSEITTKVYDENDILDDADNDVEDDADDDNLSPNSNIDSKTPSKGKWTSLEDDILKEAVEKHGGKNWKKISELLVDRTDVQCLHRWQKVLRPGLIKGPWTQEVRLFYYSFFHCYLLIYRRTTVSGI